MALADWLSGLRRGWMRTATQRSLRQRPVPLVAEVRPLEPRQMLSGMAAGQ